MNPFEIFGLLAAGAVLIHGLLAVLMWLEARFMDSRTSDPATAGDEPADRA